jgi:sn-glycerol 3-phosphate transport system substrate-binding protein
MIRKSIFAALASLGLACTTAQAQTEIHWWHSMGGALGDKVSELANKFNASQKDYKVVPTYKGSYPESMTAAIAAYRAGNAPHILQVFEVGTATMMAAKGAIVPVYKLMKDADEPFNPKAYIGPVAGYYTDANGNMLSFPFNSSTAIFYWNKDAFKKAGLDPNKPPRTWKELRAAAEKLKASGMQCAYTTTWPSWVHVENFSAWHNVPIATKQNGLGGLDTEFRINSPLHVRQLTFLADMAKDGLFSYAGRTNQAGAKFTSGECAMMTESTGGQANVRRGAKFDWAVTEIPYWDDVSGAPQNAIIGGASLWVMGGKTNNAYKGVARFFSFLSRPEIQMEWHKDTGYVPITYAAYEMTKKSGFYQQNPGAEVAIKMLTNKPATPNSRGLRFGNFVQGRELIQEEMEAAIAGKKPPKEALDDAVRRGNEILRKFESANRG